MTNLSTTEPGAARVNYRRLWWAGLLALAASLAAVALVRALALAVLDVDPAFNPLVLPSFVPFTLAGVVGAVIALAVIGRLSRRPARTFHIVALMALILSFLPDVALLAFGVPGATLATISVLMLMHIVVYAITVGLLVRLAVA